MNDKKVRESVLRMMESVAVLLVQLCIPALCHAQVESLS